MVAMFHALAHLFAHIFVRWYTFLGTSPGGIAAQIITLLLTEVQGGWWRLQAWKTSWKGGLKRGGLALGSVWLLTFIGCIVITLYEDHRELVAANRRLAEENDRLRKPAIKMGDAEKDKRIAIRMELTKLLARNTEISERCQRDERPKGFSCWAEWIHWRDQTRKYISKNMEPSYLARFKATMGTHMYYKSTPSGKFLEGEESDAVNGFTFSAGTLDQFIREFQN